MVKCPEVTPIPERFTPIPRVASFANTGWCTVRGTRGRAEARAGRTRIPKDQTLPGRWSVFSISRDVSGTLHVASRASGRLSSRPRLLANLLDEGAVASTVRVLVIHD